MNIQPIQTNYKHFTEKHPHCPETVCSSIDSIYSQRPSIQFVLLRPHSKIPAWRGWNTRCPNQDKVVIHLTKGGNLGIVPSSIGLIAMDIDKHITDKGYRNQFKDQFHALGIFFTNRGFHLLFTANQQSPSLTSKFDIGGTQGDIIYKGAIKLHQPEQQLPVLDRILKQDEVIHLPDCFDTHEEETRWRSNPGSVDIASLRSVQPGGRYHALMGIKQYAYQEFGRGTIHCKDTCRNFYQSANNLFPEPLPIVEANGISDRQWRWMDKNLTRRDTAARRGRLTDEEFSQIQSGRGQLGGWATAQIMRDILAPLKTNAIRMTKQGLTDMEIADILGKSKNTVRRWKREQNNLINKRGLS